MLLECNDALRAQLAEAHKDTLRLDWLDAQGPEVVDNACELLWGIYGADECCHESDSPRRAIDSARDAARTDTQPEDVLEDRVHKDLPGARAARTNRQPGSGEEGT